MNYPSNIEDKLGVRSVKDFLSNKCAGALGKKWVQKAAFLSDNVLITKLQDQNFEFVQLLQEGYSFPISEYSDPSQALHSAKIEGAILDEKDLFDIKLSLSIITKSCEFLITSPPEQFLELRKLTDNITIDRQLYKSLESTFDRSGRIKDDATPDLRAIRKGIISESSGLRKTVLSVLRRSIESGYTDAESQPTLRNGRMVIPVKAENKRLVKGLIHDESATGQTSFIEPEEVFTVNNRLRELYSKEKREIFKILRDLTRLIRDNIDDINEAYRFLGKIDFIHAKAHLAVEFNAIKPTIIDQPFIELNEAYHPVLWLHQRKEKKIKPINFKIDSSNRIILISGPNAGGKSVTLKTIGLLQYLFQCGFPLPIGDKCTLGIFKDIFVDIGDEQSLENELSTYSAHLKNMHYFTQNCSPNTLFLIDEFGTGTEPEYGGAVAEAILVKLHNKKSFGVITTHYSNLKEFAEKQEGINNAAMLYDVKNLQPLYEFEIGKPGSSFALEIATKIGMDQSTIQYASKKIGFQKVKYDRTLKELEYELEEAKQQNILLRDKERRFEKNLSEYRELKEYLDQKKKFIVNEAKKEAKIIISKANKEVENLLVKIKSNAVDKTVVKEVRKEFEKKTLEFEASPIIKNPDTQKSSFEILKGDIAVGDYVQIKDQEANGKVISLKGKTALVELGEMRLNIKVGSLSRIRAPKIEKRKPSSNAHSLDYVEKNLDFNPEIDVRGQRTKDTLEIVDKLIDDAIVLGVKELRILHGKGDGILRAMIRQHIDKYNSIETVRSEHVEFGGDGISIVTLK